MESMTGKHIFLFAFGTGVGAGLMHLWMKHEAKEKVASTQTAGLQYVPEQVKQQY